MHFDVKNIDRARHISTSFTDSDTEGFVAKLVVDSLLENLHDDDRSSSHERITRHAIYTPHKRTALFSLSLSLFFCF